MKNHKTVHVKSNKKKFNRSSFWGDEPVNAILEFFILTEENKYFKVFRHRHLQNSRIFNYIPGDQSARAPKKRISQMNFKEKLAINAPLMKTSSLLVMCSLTNFLIVLAPNEYRSDYSLFRTTLENLPFLASSSSSRQRFFSFFRSRSRSRSLFTTR